MATKSITIHVGEEEVTLLLKPASQRDGVRRATLMATSREGEMADRSEIEKQVAFYKYPTCVCCVREPERIAQMTFDQFMEVDEQDIDAWVQAAYDLNPQWAKAWKLMAEMTEQEAKKVGTPSDGSSEPTPQPEPETSPLSRS